VTDGQKYPALSWTALITLWVKPINEYK